MGIIPGSERKRQCGTELDEREKNRVEARLTGDGFPAIYLKARAWTVKTDACRTGQHRATVCTTNHMTTTLVLHDTRSTLPTAGLVVSLHSTVSHNTHTASYSTLTIKGNTLKNWSWLPNYTASHTRLQWSLQYRSSLREYICGVKNDGLFMININTTHW